MDPDMLGTSWRLLPLALVFTIGCTIDGPGPDDEPPDDVYDPNDGIAEGAEYANHIDSLRLAFGAGRPQR